MNKFINIVLTFVGFVYLIVGILLMVGIKNAPLCGGFFLIGAGIWQYVLTYFGNVECLGGKR